MIGAYELCVSAGLECILNDQTATGGMIASAPGALWAWGWYSFSTNDVYSFAPGAVGAQLTSYTAESIRYQKRRVPLWLERHHRHLGRHRRAASTATRGRCAALERRPFGRRFASPPKAGRKMVFVGDPLFAAFADRTNDGGPFGHTPTCPGG
jgi:hypothetical protein